MFLLRAFHAVKKQTKYTPLLSLYPRKFPRSDLCSIIFENLGHCGGSTGLISTHGNASNYPLPSQQCTLTHCHEAK